MVSFTGILHPSSYPVRDLIQTNKVVFPSPVSEFFHHKNLEMGIFGEHFNTAPDHVHLIFDGTILNAKELKMELQKNGYYELNTDLDILSCAYACWNEDFIQKIEGDFVIALFDEKKEELFLFRDHMGKKNLYWTKQRGFFFFSTEIKGLLATGRIPQTPSQAGMSSYLYFGYIPQDMTPIKNVNKLLPAHMLKLDLQGNFFLKPYWSFSQAFSGKKKKTHVEDDFNNKLESVLDRSLRQDGQKGVLNLETSASELIYTKLSAKEKIDSFSLIHEDKDHYSKLINIIWHLDEPIADQTILSKWVTAQQISKKSNILYIDAGWEEMLGAKERYFNDRKKTLPLSFTLASLKDGFIKRGLIDLLGHINPAYKWKILQNININREMIEYLYESAIYSEKDRKKGFKSLYPFFDPEIFTQRFHRLVSLPENIETLIYFDAKTRLPDRKLRQYERLFNPFGIKLIAPFTDIHLVEYLAQVPLNIKRTLLQQRPEKKIKLTPPKSSTLHLLKKGVLVEDGLVSSKWIDENHYEMDKIWPVLVLEIWFRLYISKTTFQSDFNIALEDFLQN